MSTDPYSVDLRGAAKHVGVGRDTILQAINAGRLPAFRSTERVLDNGDTVPAGKYLIRLTDLEAWVDGLSAA